MSAIRMPTGAGGTTTPPPKGGGPRPWKWTREGYHKLGDLGVFDGRRVQLIFGEIIEMGKQGWLHVLGKSKTMEILRQAFAGIGWVSEQSPLPFQDSEPEPDLAVIAGQMTDYSDHPTTALLIVEVADTSLSLDTTTKAELYATVGIADYWVLDVNGKQLHVFRDPQHNAALEATAYQTHDTFGPNDSVSPLAAPHSTVRVADLLP